MFSQGKITIVDTIKINSVIFNSPWTEGTKVMDKDTFENAIEDGLNKRKLKRLFNKKGYYYIDKLTFHSFLRIINEKTSEIDSYPCSFTFLGNKERKFWFKDYPRVELNSYFLVVKINKETYRYLYNEGFIPKKNLKDSHFIFLVPLCLRT